VLPVPPALAGDCPVFTSGPLSPPQRLIAKGELHDDPRHTAAGHLQPLSPHYAAAALSAAEQKMCDFRRCCLYDVLGTSIPFADCQLKAWIKERGFYGLTVLF
jgi:hypothetical protein